MDNPVTIKKLETKNPRHLAAWCYGDGNDDQGLPFHPGGLVEFQDDYVAIGENDTCTRDGVTFHKDEVPLLIAGLQEAQRRWRESQ